jgi:hypothetical protein
LARFAARFSKYSHGVRSAEVEHYATGREKVIAPGLEAQFEVLGVTNEDYREALEHLTFTGLPFDIETESVVEPRSRLAVFDSRQAQQLHRWSEDDHDLVVKTLRESPMLGVEFIELSSAAIQAPWKGYDDVETPEEIISLIKATGSDAGQVIAYERENANRPEVIDALVDSMAAADQPVIVGG